MVWTPQTGSTQRSTSAGAATSTEDPAQRQAREHEARMLEVMSESYGTGIVDDSRDAAVSEEARDLAGRFFGPQAFSSSVIPSMEFTLPDLSGLERHFKQLG